MIPLQYSMSALSPSRRLSLLTSIIYSFWRMLFYNFIPIKILVLSANFAPFSPFYPFPNTIILLFLEWIIRYVRQTRYNYSR